MSKIAVISGASAGIGKATALLFMEKGYTVYNLSRKPAEGINSLTTDVTNKQNVADSIKEIYDKEGKIDILINCAGMGISGAVEDTCIQSVEKIFAVNFFGTLYTCQCVLPYMRMAKYGRIINLSSAAAKLSIPFQSFYSATKSAISSLSEALCLEVKPFNIKVTSILPGDVKTEFTARREKNISNNPVYGERIDKSVGRMEKDEQNGMPPIAIARQILKIANMKNPPVSAVGGMQYAMLIGLTKILPQRLISFIIGKIYG